MTNFIDNKYTKWYYKIIERSKNRIIDGYHERHHIIPKSLGGTNRKDNLVSLTAREHFICHLLLVKMTNDGDKKKMSYALWLIINIENKNQRRYKINSKKYDKIRKEHSSMLSKKYSGKSFSCDSFKGKKHKKETIEYFSKIKLGKNNPNYGVRQKPEWNEAKSISQKGIMKPKICCLGCRETVGGHGNLSRWHTECIKVKNLL